MTTELQPVGEPDGDLTPVERDRLVKLEAVVERGLKTYVEVGLALTEIRAKRLYRETHETIEDYCRERWGFVASRARQLIGAAELTTATGLTLANESQARALIPLRRDEGPEAVVEVVEAAKAEFGDDVTAALLRKAIAERRGYDQRKIEREERSRRNREIAENVRQQEAWVFDMPERPLSLSDPAFFALDHPVSRAPEIALGWIADGLIESGVVGRLERVAAFANALVDEVREAGIE